MIIDEKKWEYFFKNYFSINIIFFIKRYFKNYVLLIKNLDIQNLNIFKISI